MESLSQNVMVLAIQFVPFMIAVVFHEFAHGYIARQWGDTTAQDQGRLTLNPVPHIDPLGTLVFPILMMLSGLHFLIGWAKPVPINPTRFRKYRPGLFWVSLAGPGMNFLLAVVSAILLCVLLKFSTPDFYFYEPLTEMAKMSVGLNIMLGLFNLIPLPPLDGSKIVESFLSYNATQTYEKIAPYSFFILIALLMTGLLNVLSPVTYFLANGIFALVGPIFGLA